MLWSIVFIVILTWATITPPFQGQDESAHFYRAQSILYDFWISENRQCRVSYKIENPLIYANNPNKSRFRPARVLSDSEIVRLREYGWPKEVQQNRIDYNIYPSEATHYPPLYYTSVMIFAEAVRFLLNPLPYEAFYLYRYVSCLLSISLWIVVALRLRKLLVKPALAHSLTALMILVPTNAFTSASINPDSILNPLSTWLFIELYRAIIKSEFRSQIISFILACIIMLVKPVAPFILIAFASACLILVIYSGQWKTGLITCLFATSGASIGYLSFYPEILAHFINAGDDSNFINYLGYLFSYRLSDLVKQFWGSFGSWNNFRLPEAIYDDLGLLLMLNIAALLLFFRSRGSLRLACFSLLTFICMIAALMLMEYYLQTHNYNRDMLQGRYVFPAMIGFAAIFHHKISLLRLAMILVLLYANYQGYQQSFRHYYAMDNLKLKAALPFSSESLLTLKLYMR